MKQSFTLFINTIAVTVAPKALLGAIALATFVFTQTARAQMTCERVDTAAPLRAESIAELLPDVVLRCTGGESTPAGDAIPQFQVLVTANTSITSRVLGAGSSSLGTFNEALLLIDEPDPSSQLPCIPAAGANGCAAVKGTAQPNVFQAVALQSNTTVFAGVPIDAPGAGATRTLRITNIRADMTGLPANVSPIVAQLSVQVFESSGAALTITNAAQISGSPVTGLLFSVRTASDASAPNIEPALSAQISDLTPTVSSALTPLFHVAFTESFAGAFHRRNIATSAPDPIALASQSIAGWNYQTETGFYNASYPDTDGLSLAGLADVGTRLKLTLQNIPNGVQVWVSVRDISPGTTGYSMSLPKAILEYSDSGAFNPVLVGVVSGYWPLAPINGEAQAYWEIVGSDPASADEFSFAVALTQGSSTSELGAATAYGSLAPTAANRGDGLAPIPHFLETPAPLPAFSIVAAAPGPGISTVNAASYATAAIAPGSIASVFGTGLAPYAQSSTTGLDSSLAGTTVQITDYTGLQLAAHLFFVGPEQINFLLDPSTSPGPAAISIYNGSTLVGSGLVMVNSVAPGLFAANSDGKGVAAGDLQVVQNGQSEYFPLSQFYAQSNTFLPTPVSLGPNGALAFLSLYGTGFRFGAMNSTSVSIGGTSIPVIYIGPQSQYAGLDQLVVGPVPQSLVGKGVTDVVMIVGGQQSNSVQLAF